MQCYSEMAFLCSTLQMSSADKNLIFNEYCLQYSLFNFWCSFSVVKHFGRHVLQKIYLNINSVKYCENWNCAIGYVVMIFWYLILLSYQVVDLDVLSPFHYSLSTPSCTFKGLNANTCTHVHTHTHMHIYHIISPHPVASRHPSREPGKRAHGSYSQQAQKTAWESASYSSASARDRCHPSKEKKREKFWSSM